MANLSTAKKVIDLIKKPIEDTGIQLWDVRYVKEGSSWYLRVFIDKEGGIDIDDCSNVSHLIDPIIDEADPIKESYYLEVCSPGIERELVTEEHFAKFIGADVMVKLIRPLDGQKLLFGSLLKYENGNVTVKLGDTDTEIKKENIQVVKLDDFNS